MVRTVEELSEFDELIAGDAPVIVDFTATWCGPCKQMCPEFERLAQTPGKLTFIKVDVDEGEDITEKVGISSMPTFKVFQNGKEVDGFTGADKGNLQAMVDKFKGGETGAKAAAGGADDKKRPAEPADEASEAKKAKSESSEPSGKAPARGGVQEVDDLAEFDTLIGTDAPVIGYFTATWCGPCKMIKPEFLKLAQTPGKLTFIKVDVDDAEEITEKVGISGMPSFRVFQNGKEVEGFTGAEAPKLHALVAKFSGNAPVAAPKPAEDDLLDMF